MQCAQWLLAGLQFSRLAAAAEEPVEYERRFAGQVQGSLEAAGCT